MFECDPSRTERWAVQDVNDDSLLEFARRSIDGQSEVVWHFATLSAIDHLSRDDRLAAVGNELRLRGSARVADTTVHLETQQKRSACGARVAAAVWWADDTQVLTMDTGHRPSLGALVTTPQRAPIWVTAFGVTIDGQDDTSVGVQAPMTGFAGRPLEVMPLEVSDELQEAITRRSRPMTLNNGVGDNLVGPLLREAKGFVAAGGLPATVGVAALRAGWWPYKVPGLLKKL